MRQESRLTAQGRLTIPADIRKRANLRAGSRFTWEVDPDGNILLRPMRLGLSDVAGMFKLDHPLSAGDIRKAISVR